MSRSCLGDSVDLVRGSPETVERAAERGETVLRPAQHERKI